MWKILLVLTQFELCWMFGDFLITAPKHGCWDVVISVPALFGATLPGDYHSMSP